MKIQPSEIYDIYDGTPIDVSIAEITMDLDDSGLTLDIQQPANRLVEYPLRIHQR